MKYCKPCTCNLYSTSPLTPDGIIDKVCAHFKIKRFDLVGKRKTNELCGYRYMVMKLLKSNSSITLNKIGELLGGRGHDTIIHGLKKFKTFYEREDKFKSDYLRLKMSI